MVSESINADFERSISFCGYGRFNYILAVCLIPITCSQMFVSGVASFILPAAGCDLNLTELQKGTLNAAVYIGNVIGGLACGIAGDTYGRRKLMLTGFVAEFLCSIAAGFITSYLPLVLLRVLSGILIAAPNSVVPVYLAETHSDALRAKTLMWIGMGNALAGVLQPALAYLVIPSETGLGGMASWRLFLFLCSAPSLLSAFVCLFLPESPKFLMSQGREKEALTVFGKIYSLNTGNQPLTFPVTSLSCNKAADSGVANNEKRMCDLNARQFRTLLRRPYITRLVHITFIQVGLMVSINSIRLWTPQLFTMLEQFDSQDPSDISTVCSMIGSSLEDKPYSGPQPTCLPIKQQVYLRSLIIGAVNTSSFLVTSNLIGRIGKTSFLVLFFSAAATAAFAFSLASSANVFLALLCVFTLLTANTESAVSAVQVDLFPTSIRAISYSLMILNGRIGTISGSIVLPILIAVSCESVFYCIAVCLIACSVLAWLLRYQRADEATGEP